jgi:hypothetical protein
MLPTDADTNRLFDQVVEELQARFRYSAGAAAALAREYYMRFRDPQFCESIGVPVQDDDFFFHEAAGGMALRVHYYLGIKEDPNPSRYIEWRTNYFRQLRAVRRGE